MSSMRPVNGIISMPRLSTGREIEVKRYSTATTQATRRPVVATMAAILLANASVLASFSATVDVVAGKAALTVLADGPGIPEDIADRLFQPFVSGRPGGSGLGLAIVQRAVEAHRGLITVASAVGEGTTFTIFLPTNWSAEEDE